MLSKNDKGQIWYWGGEREHQFKENLIEKWIPDFDSCDSNFIPDIIFARGAFKEYLWCSFVYTQTGFITELRQK